MRNRLWPIAAALAVGAGCWDASGPVRSARVWLAPLLDTLFVGDTQTPPLTVTYLDAQGDTQPAGAVTWASGDAGVATVDAAGRVAGVGRGEAVIRATANGVTGTALVVVTRTLDVTPLLDTVFLMTGDTFTVPVQVRRKGGAAPDPWFEATPQALFTIDSATGLVTANNPGNPFPYVVHADTVADTGAVHVLQLGDTTGGRAYFALFGTVIRRQSAPVRAINYRLADNSQAFWIEASVLSGGTPIENVIVALPDSVTVPDAFAIDSISPAEVFGTGASATCRPPRPWGLWASARFTPPLNAFSRQGGTISITQVDTVPGGLVVSGRFAFDAQRLDLYTDPFGRLPIRGTFVTPVVTRLDTCPT